MKRTKMLIATTAIVSLLMATTALAGTWQTGKDANQNKWWYDNGDGTYVQNGWQWIDGNSDGIAESYYFDVNGWLLTNTTTPDGYTVNESGAWVENGAVQTKAISTAVTVAPENAAMFLTEGYYRYYKTDIFDENTQKTVSNGQIYDGTRESEYEILQNDRYPFQLVADPVWNIKIGKVADNSFSAYYEEVPEYKEYFNENTAWAVVYNKDGDKWRPVGSESEPDYYCVINDKDTFTLYDTYNRINPETGEPTGQVYTEIRTYKKIQ